MRAYMRYGVAFIAILLLLPAAATQSEPIQTRARDDFVASMKELAEGFEAAGRIAANSPMLCPVPGSEFVPSFGAPRVGHSHQGVDMMAPEGTRILAPASGYLEQHGSESFYLTDTRGTQYFGTHLSAQEGPSREVVRGEVIGYVGHTGNASPGADHLHFEIHPGGGAAIDPYPETRAACDRDIAEFGARLDAASMPEVELVAESAIAAPQFVFGGAEVTRWYNSTRPRPERITLEIGRMAARYFNGLVHRYLVAVERAKLVRRWSGVAQCESGGNWSINTGNGYYGGLQFNLGTWAAYGGSSRPDLQPAWYQATIAERVRAGSQGLGAWPHCGAYYR